jgi:hypothetical protein
MDLQFSVVVPKKDIVWVYHQCAILSVALQCVVFQIYLHLHV